MRTWSARTPSTSVAHCQPAHVTEREEVEAEKEQQKQEEQEEQEQEEQEEQEETPSVCVWREWKVCYWRC